MEEKTPHNQLRKDVLGTYDALAQSIALLSLALSVALTTSLAAGAAGATAPLAYLLAGLGCLCLAYVFIRFARFLPSSGGTYTYIARGLGPIAGFLGGWMYSAAFTLGIAFTLTIAIVSLLPLLAAIHITVHWFVLYIVLLAVLFLCAFFDIRISTRSQLVLAAAGILSIFVLVVIILGKGGASGLSLTPFSIAALPNGLSGLFFAMVFGFTAFIGFEAATVLGEETVNPQRAIPRAVLSAVLVGIVFYVLVVYCFSVGYGIAHVGDWAKDQAPLDTLSNRYAGPVLTTIIDLMVALGGLMASLGTLNLTSRLVYTMGRDRGLPSVFGRTHSRYKSPWVALLFVTLLTLLLGATLGLKLGPFDFFGFLAAIATQGILLAYILVSFSAIVFFWRSEMRSKKPLVRILDVVLPLITIFLCGAGIFQFRMASSSSSFKPCSVHRRDMVGTGSDRGGMALDNEA